MEDFWPVRVSLIIGLIFYCKKNKRVASTERIDPAAILQNNILNTIQSPDEEFKATYNTNFQKFHDAKSEKTDTPGFPNSDTSDDSIPDLE